MSEDTQLLEGVVVVEPGAGDDAKDSVFVGEGAPNADGGAGENPNPPSEPNMLSEEQFYVMVKHAFAAPQMVSPIFAPVAIQSNEEAPARLASNSAHALLKIYYPAALMPGGETLGHILMIAPFLVGKIMIIRAIIQEARRPEPTRNDTNGEEPK